MPLNSVLMEVLFLFVIVFLIVAPCSCLGCWLSAHKPGLGKWLLATTAVLGTTCSGFAYLSTLYPGPVSHYLNDSREAFIVNWITTPSQYLWLLLFVWVSTTVAYFLQQFTEGPSGAWLAVTLLNLVCAILFYLPMIFFGFAIHAAPM